MKKRLLVLLAMMLFLTLIILTIKIVQDYSAVDAVGTVPSMETLVPVEPTIPIGAPSGYVEPTTLSKDLQSGQWEWSLPDPEYITITENCESCGLR